jgi:TolB-like protein
LPFPGKFSEKIRLHVSQDESLIEFGGFRLDPAERSLVAADGTPIQLTRRLYETLLYMVERPGRLLEKQSLLDAIWKGTVVEENTLSRTVSALRQLLGDGTSDLRFIETVSGVGYRFIQPVNVIRARAREHGRWAPEAAVAVLPFVDLSRERDQGYFADGIAEEVLNRLATVPELRVIAKSSSFRFRGRDDGAQAIGKVLGVDYLLVGSVRKERDSLRVTVQLIEAARDSQVWSDRFDRAFDVDDLFAIQDDIARAVVLALGTALGVDALGSKNDTSGPDSTTRDLEAYDLYLRGKAMLEQSGGPAAVRSAELFRAAVSRDPSFASAWHGLAFANMGRMMFAPESAQGAREEIGEAVKRTLSLAPNWWLAHLGRALAMQGRREWIGYEQALTRAAQLAPGMPAPLNRTLGTFYAHVHELTAAVEQFREAVRVEPLSMLVSGIYQAYLMVVGRVEEAEAEYRRSADLPGDREMVEHLALHRLWARGAPFSDDLRVPFSAQLRRYLDLTATKPAPVLEDVYGVCSEPALVVAKLRAATAAPEYQNPTRQLVLAWWLAAYGDGEAAFAATWRGFVDMAFFNASWLWWPVLAPVRAHARFPELLAKIGLSDYWRAKGRTPVIA